MLKQRWEGVPFWTDVEAQNAINEALLFWNLCTGFWKRTETMLTAAGNFEYGLPGSIVFGTRVTYDGAPLAPSSIAEMDWGHPGWRAQTTTDGGNVPNAVQIWLPLSIDLIAVWPQPPAGHTLSIDGISTTPQLLNPSDTVDIGKEALNAILGYALHVAAFKEGGERFNATMGYFTEFLKEAATENDQLVASQMFREFVGLDERRSEVPAQVQSSASKVLNQKSQG